MDLRRGNCLTVGEDGCHPGIPHFSELIRRRLPIFVPRPDGSTAIVRPRNVEELHRIEQLRTNPGLPNLFWAEFRALEVLSNHWFLQPRLKPLSCNYFIVYIEVSVPKFDGQPLLVGQEYYPGPEWHDKQPFWWQVIGDRNPSLRRKNPKRAELWKLRINEQIIIIDTSGRVRLLRFRLGQAELVPVDVPFVMDYLCMRASMYTEIPSLLWVCSTVRRLRASHPDPDRVFRREQAYVEQRLNEARSTARTG